MKNLTLIAPSQNIAETINTKSEILAVLFKFKTLGYFIYCNLVNLKFDVNEKILIFFIFSVHDRIARR